MKLKSLNHVTALSAGLIIILNHASPVFAADVPTPASNPADTPHVILAPGAKLELLSDGFKFTEGPAADRDGNVFFTDQPNDRIMKWSVDGKLTTFMQPSGRANGLEFDAQGNLIACADEKDQLWLIDPSGKVTVLVENYNGKLLNGPNDVWVHPKGGYYFTDPFYRRDYWTHKDKPQDGEHVYYLSADRKVFMRVTDDLKQPNGIIGTPDGKQLFVADIGAGKTYCYTIAPDFKLTDKKLFTEMGSDGMTLDEQGNVYLTGRGVTVFDRDGKKIDHIDVPKGWTANVTFGGKDRKTLFITAQDSFYAVKTKFRGY
jgi:gluconolactonase